MVLLMEPLLEGVGTLSFELMAQGLPLTGAIGADVSLAAVTIDDE
jgi:hypothetical protein